MKSKYNTVPPSLIEAGFYYEKGNSPGWLRCIIDFCGHEGRVRYVDFTPSWGAIDMNALPILDTLTPTPARRIPFDVRARRSSKPPVLSQQPLTADVECD